MFLVDSVESRGAPAMCSGWIDSEESSLVFLGVLLLRGGEFGSYMARGPADALEFRV